MLKKIEWPILTIIHHLLVFCPWSIGNLRSVLVLGTHELMRPGPGDMVRYCVNASHPCTWSPLSFEERLFITLQDLRKSTFHNTDVLANAPRRSKLLPEKSLPTTITKSNMINCTFMPQMNRLLFSNHFAPLLLENTTSEAEALGFIGIPGS